LNRLGVDHEFDGRTERPSVAIARCNTGALMTSRKGYFTLAREMALKLVLALANAELVIRRTYRAGNNCHNIHHGSHR